MAVLIVTCYRSLPGVVTSQSLDSVLDTPPASEQWDVRQLQTAGALPSSGGAGQCGPGDQHAAPIQSSTTTSSHARPTPTSSPQGLQPPVLQVQCVRPKHRRIQELSSARLQAHHQHREQQPGPDQPQADARHAQT